MVLFLVTVFSLAFSELYGSGVVLMKSFGHYEAEQFLSSGQSVLILQSFR